VKTPRNQCGDESQMRLFRKARRAGKPGTLGRTGWRVILTARNYSPTEGKNRVTRLQPNVRFPLNVIM
jgi:hypothetical protein